LKILVIVLSELENVRTNIVDLLQNTLEGTVFFQHLIVKEVLLIDFKAIEGHLNLVLNVQLVLLPPLFTVHHNDVPEPVFIDS